MLNKAMKFSVRRHSGQTTKPDHHTFFILEAMLSLENKADGICAVLHDVYEDRIQHLMISGLWLFC